MHELASRWGLHANPYRYSPPLDSKTSSEDFIRESFLIRSIKFFWDLFGVDITGQLAFVCRSPIEAMELAPSFVHLPLHRVPNQRSVALGALLGWRSGEMITEVGGGATTIFFNLYLVVVAPEDLGSCLVREMFFIGGNALAWFGLWT